MTHTQEEPGLEGRSTCQTATKAQHTTARKTRASISQAVCVRVHVSLCGSVFPGVHVCSPMSPCVYVSLGGSVFPCVHVSLCGSVFPDVHVCSPLSPCVCPQWECVPVCACVHVCTCPCVGVCSQVCTCVSPCFHVCVSSVGVCSHVCMCPCVHVSLCGSVFPCAHVSLCGSVFPGVHVCSPMSPCVCVPVWECVPMCACVPMCVSPCPRVCVCPSVGVCSQVCMCVPMCVPMSPCVCVPFSGTVFPRVRVCAPTTPCVHVCAQTWVHMPTGAQGDGEAVASTHTGARLSLHPCAGEPDISLSKALQRTPFLFSVGSVGYSRRKSRASQCHKENNNKGSFPERD